MKLKNIRPSGKMTIREYKNEMLRVRYSGKACAVYKSDPKPSIEPEYHEAMETLRNLQSVGGSLLIGCNPFDLSIEIHGRTKADGSNVYKAIEDAINKVVYWDDQQNVHFNAEKFGES